MRIRELPTAYSERQRWAAAHQEALRRMAAASGAEEGFAAFRTDSDRGPEAPASAALDLAAEGRPEALAFAC